MKRCVLIPAAALLGLGLFCGCANMTANECGEREGLFSRWFGNRHRGECECIETGHVTVGEGPVIPEPACGTPCCGTPGFVPPSIPVTPTYPTMPPPAALPFPNPLAQPVPANPSSLSKDAAK